MPRVELRVYFATFPFLSHCHQVRTFHLDKQVLCYRQGEKTICKCYYVAWGMQETVRPLHKMGEGGGGPFSERDRNRGGGGRRLPRRKQRKPRHTGTETEGRLKGGSSNRAYPTETARGRRTMRTMGRATARRGAVVATPRRGGAGA